MEVRILGPLEVWTSGVRIQVGGARQCAVLAMLALQVNQVVSTDYLVDGLWGETPPGNALGTVQVYMSRLRKALQLGATGEVLGGTVRRLKPGYFLEMDPDHLDLCRFQRLAREGTQALPTAPAQASQLLGSARVCGGGHRSSNSLHCRLRWP